MRVRLPNVQLVFPQLHHLLLVLFLACVGLIWVKSLGILPTHADTSYPESALVHTAQLAAQSGRLYPPLDDPPYTPAPYGPLFYSLLALAGRVCKGDAYEIRLLLRAIVFASYLLVGLLGYLLARSTGASRNAAALAAAAVWTAPQLWMFWNVTVRPDFPGLLLCLTGLWIIARRSSPTLSAVFLSGIFCAGALLIKQSFVAVPLAIALFFALRRSYRNLAVFAATGLLVALSFIGYLTLRGEPVLQQIFLIGHSPLSVHSGVSVLYSSLSVGLAALVVAGGVTGFLLALKASGQWTLQLFACYFLVAGVVATLTLFNVGRNPYYLFEFWCIACLLATPVLSQAETVWGEMSLPVRTGAAIGLLLLAAQSLLEIRHPVQLVTEYNFDRLQGLHILSGDPSLTVRGKNPELLDPFLTTILEQQHLWTASEIVDEVSRGQFDVVFTSRANQKISPSVLQSLGEYYEPLCQTSAILVMTPKRRPVRFSASDASYTLRETCE